MTENSPLRDLATVLGFLTMTFSDLEYSIDGLIGYLLDLEGPRRLTVTGRLTAEGRHAMLKDCVEHWPRISEMQSHAQKFLQFAATFDTCRIHRNRYVHSLWLSADDAESPHHYVRFKTRAAASKAKEEGKATTRDIIDAAAANIDLANAISAHFTQSPDLPDWAAICPRPHSVFHKRINALVAALLASDHPPQDQNDVGGLLPREE